MEIESCQMFGNMWKKELETRKGLSPKFLLTKGTCFYYFYFSYELKFLE